MGSLVSFNFNPNKQELSRYQSNLKYTMCINSVGVRGCQVKSFIECLKFFYLILSKVNFRLENPKDMSIGSGLQTGDCSQASCDTNCNFNKKNSGNDVQLDFLEIPGGFTLPTQGATFKYDIKVPNILIMIILL